MTYKKSVNAHINETHDVNMYLHKDLSVHICAQRDRASEQETDGQRRERENVTHDIPCDVVV